MENELRALVMDYGDTVVIQALELDISAQGQAFEQAAGRFDTAVRAELLYCATSKTDPNVTIGSAPAFFLRHGSRAPKATHSQMII